ncbi:MAG: hypothetical protein WCH39_03005 [Schlesneria sp.]
MSLIRSQIEGGRRPLAVGIWSFLVMLMPISGTHVSSELSFWVLILVSLLCTAAILIVDEIQSHCQSNPGFRRHLPAAISLVIAALWAILLSERSRPFFSSGSAIMGLAPIMLAAVWRASRPGPCARVIPSTDQTANSSYQTETANEATPERIRKETGEAASTVPFSQTSLSILGEISEETSRDSSDFTQPDDVTHWLTRSKTSDGEIIEGGTRVEFADGQRDVTVHISFCPPFTCVPTIDTEDLDGNGLEIRVAAVFPFGARLTVRRSAVSKSEYTANSARSGRIGFVAIASGNVRRIA